ncbi:toxin-antitoxin system YwqK family antitoxin [Ancylomarina longa]|uniref:Toxin-antitoxin system YwqK family antitoxin n=1 Tax=Ancylomarina longa TaxID=2487017 RepID=A0A434AGJ2_9BACT|nr:hypothetical protein [Ancylomarina longa]RUT73499.1 hypothetical protein DLK05_12930 [Ancylomarina longa]
MRNIVLILLLLVLISCDQKTGKQHKKEADFVENGVVKQYDRQNRLVGEVTFRNGVRDGISRIYYPSGVLSDEIMYVDDEKSGVAKKYHKNGKIYSLTPYVKDEKEGLQKKYYSNGKIWAETPYYHGQAGIGLKEYKRDGSLREHFPSIEVQKFISNDRVELKFFLSNYSKRVVFYVSDLMKGKYIPPLAKPMYSEGGSVQYIIPRNTDTILDTTINIVAKYQTRDYNIFVTQHRYHVSVN